MRTIRCVFAAALRNLVVSACAALVLPLALTAGDLAGEAYGILKTNCFVCHGAAMQMSGLDLRTREKALQGGERGPAVSPTSLDLSFAWKFATHLAKPEMPPGRKLSDDDLETLRKWILAAAPYPEMAVTDEEVERRAVLRKLEERPITEEERAWWAFRPPVRVEPPGREGTSIDRFLSARLADEGVEPAPATDKRTLIRRAYLDLIGLPPSPEEVSEFVADRSPDAFEKLVDRLLASRHYGERWGRHWLDLVHYADSGGYERDFDWPTMWRYRDYVIQAFNDDKPYDRFIREQIAGDEIDPDNPDAHIATGYLRLILDNNIKDERTRMDELDDNVSTTALTFLGMTVGCARCHNHKFDPIPQKDYYQMQAVFFSTKEVDYPLVLDDVVERHRAANEAVDAEQKVRRERIAGIEKTYRERIFAEKFDELPSYYREAWKTPKEKRSEGQRLNARQVEVLFRQIKAEEMEVLMSVAERTERETLQLEINELDEQRPTSYPTARTVTEESADALPSYFLHRGNPGSKGSQLEPGVLSVAAWQPVRYEPPPAEARTSHRRRQFAEWIASENNPLTARVMVNRIWQHHFGEGIVRSSSNFGKTGEKPSHPELLDWLATEFVRSGWSVKHLHRLMMNSDAYRRSSDDVGANLAHDPDNRLFWRMPRRRLEAETIRDQLLAAGGTLDRSMGGPAVKPYIDPDLWQSSTSRVWGGREVGHRGTWRRSVYVFSKRSIRYPMFEAFDQPDMVGHCSERASSTVAPQALLLMNNAEILLQAKFFAQRLAKEAGPDLEAQVSRAFQLALSRSPTSVEKQRAVDFIRNNSTGLVDFCQTLFNLNEFVYRQ